MKRFIIALVLCLVLVGVMTAPAMATSPLTFTTGLNGCTGDLESGFTLLTGGVQGVFHDLTLVDPDASVKLADGYYGLTLKANAAQKKILWDYFAKLLPYPDFYTQMIKESTGSTPFAYLKAADGVYTLVDAFSFDLFGTDTDLRIDDDYPVGTYVYMGHLKGENNEPLTVKLTLTVERVNLTGSWELDVLSGTYVHDMFISTQSPTGALTGTGGYPMTGPPYWPGYDWTLIGQITGFDVTFTVTYSGGYTATLIGEVGIDGNMSGMVPLAWTATRVP
jgi:hypothetical protein